jgi:hypothetical protein
MSNQQQTFQSSSYTSSSFTTATNGEPPKTTRHTEATVSDPRGTTVHRTSELPGQEQRQESIYIPADGQPDQAEGRGRLIDVTDADRQYEERIEDEYAKRVGGA